MEFQTLAKDRKEVVKAVEGLLGEKAKYVGPPSFGYVIGAFTIDRNGNVACESEEEGIRMQDELIKMGLAAREGDALNIAVPLEGHTVNSIINLVNMIHSKQYLITKAVGKDALKVTDSLVEKLAEGEYELEQVIELIENEDTVGLTFEEGKILFNGFPFESEKAIAFTTLVASMSQTAIKQKRISPKETIEENEKYYMRNWLVRLGLDGKGAKDVRKILLENLAGHSAFRTEADREKWNAARKAEKGVE